VFLCKAKYAVLTNSLSKQVFQPARGVWMTECIYFLVTRLCPHYAFLIFAPFYINGYYTAT
jgi:hypothetical protein